MFTVVLHCVVNESDHNDVVNNNKENSEYAYPNEPMNVTLLVGGRSSDCAYLSRHIHQFTGMLTIIHIYGCKYVH